MYVIKREMEKLETPAVVWILCDATQDAMRESNRQLTSHRLRRYDHLSASLSAYIMKWIITTSLDSVCTFVYLPYSTVADLWCAINTCRFSWKSRVTSTTHLLTHWTWNQEKTSPNWNRKWTSGEHNCDSISRLLWLDFCRSYFIVPSYC